MQKNVEISIKKDKKVYDFYAEIRWLLKISVKIGKFYLTYKFDFKHRVTAT